MIKRHPALFSLLVFQIVATLVACSGRPARAQVCHTILGKNFKLQNPLPGATPPGDPTKRKITILAIEQESADPLNGDPLANGASIEIITFKAGSTPVFETFTLPPGAFAKPPGAGWQKNGAGTKYKYKDAKATNGPVKVVNINHPSGGTFKINVVIKAKLSPVSTVPPDPGTYGGMVLEILGGGDQYAVNFGGAAGGIYRINDDTRFQITKPSSESACPTLAPTCGNGLAEPPFETCDGADDSLCSGQCGANGFPCLCPFCGDGVADLSLGEQCDYTDVEPSLCVASPFEGCTFRCKCAVCGNGIAQGGPFHPEECDGKDDEDCQLLGTTCVPNQPQSNPPSECRCKGVCGDDVVNQLNEACDGTDDDACPGLCGPPGPPSTQCKCP